VNALKQAAVLKIYINERDRYNSLNRQRQEDTIVMTAGRHWHIETARDWTKENSSRLGGKDDF